MKLLISLWLCLPILFSCQDTSKPELHVFIWSDYLKPELVEKFEKENNCQVVIDTYDSNESMYAKLKLGGPNYDIIFPSNYYLEIMVKQGFLQPIDKNKIENVIHLDPVYLKIVGDKSLEYGLPYMISNTGIAYRKDKVKDFIPSWSMFGRQDLKGRMTMLNDLREALGSGLRYLDYSINTTNPEEIQAAALQLINWKKNLAKFESEQYKNGIASAEYLVAQAYSGDILQVMQENPNVAFAYPEEGIVMSVDFLVIPAKAQNSELALKFINFLLTPDNVAENIEFTCYLSPIKPAYDKLSPAFKNNEILFPREEILKKAQLIKNLGEKLILYNKAWDKVKAEE